MSDENTRKRIATEHSNFDGDERKNEISKSLKVAVISGTTNVENFQENAVVLRNDLSKVIIKVQKSPKKSFNNNEFLKSFEEEMKDESFERNDSSGENSSYSQKIYDSILVNF